MAPDELKKRTKVFALRTIRLVEALPKGKTADIIGRQLLRSGTSVGQTIGLHAGRDRLLILSAK